MSDSFACVYWTVTFSTFKKNLENHYNKPNKVMGSHHLCKDFKAVFKLCEIE